MNLPECPIDNRGNSPRTCIPVLDISTCHMPEADGLLLNEISRMHSGEFIDGDHFPCIGAYECGGWFWVPDSVKDMGETPWSPEFTALFNRFRQQGWPYVCFDRDGTEYDDLPRYEW